MAELKSEVRTTCDLCAGPLLKEAETTSWNIPPLLRDSFCMIGSAVGGISSAFYGFNCVMPIVQKRIKGPMWLHFLVGAPPVIVFSSACAGFTGGAIPALAQLGISSYHAASSPCSSASPSPSPAQDDPLRKARTSSTL
uniref:Uncharacterized protein n=1 Tax=Kalanchoe fedtschenkoi TaxID=63787 RepID=A0A7N0RAG5_KALFE